MTEVKIENHGDQKPDEVYKEFWTVSFRDFRITLRDRAIAESLHKLLTGLEEQLSETVRHKKLKDEALARVYEAIAVGAILPKAVVSAVDYAYGIEEIERIPEGENPYLDGTENALLFEQLDRIREDLTLSVVKLNQALMIRLDPQKDSGQIDIAWKNIEFCKKLLCHTVAGIDRVLAVKS